MQCSLFFYLYAFYMTYDEIWRRLAAVSDTGEAKAMARMLIEEKFGMSHADIICGGVERLSADDELWIEEALVRLERSEPIQYVLGEAWFCGHKFSVRPGVLIPRPETEWLVERAVAVAHGLARSRAAGSVPLRILDIGTGSGCIAVSLKLSLPEAIVEAWDVSSDALDVASANAVRLGADVVFRRQDVLNVLSSGEREWDVIVSNPPYICDSERESMDRNVVDYEPSTALFVPDADPLVFYRAITRYAAASLRRGGSLLFECNTRYAADTAAMMRAAGFSRAEASADCFGKPRFAVAETDAE